MPQSKIIKKQVRLLFKNLLRNTFCKNYQLSPTIIIMTTYNHTTTFQKKKIVDMEKGQRPMIDANRKLSDRNKVLQQEVKKVEQRFSHSRDDFLTLVSEQIGSFKPK